MKRSYLRIFLELIRRDLLILRREYINNATNMTIMLFTTVVVFNYFMPGLGLGKGYGPFIMVGAIAIVGFFSVIGKVSTLVMDLENDLTITYMLSMPIPSSLVFITQAVSWAIDNILITIILFPLGKLFLYAQFDLMKISYFKLFLVFISMHLFYGFFSLWLVSIIEHMRFLNNLWMRIINPLFMFGAYFYPWEAVDKAYPFGSYLLLLNPLVYIMEGIRSATLGAAGYLPFWFSLLAIWGFIIACGTHSIHRLKKRLDCV